MKIILTQEEIQDVLEEHVNSQLSLAPGQSISVDLIEDNGSFTAEVDIRNKTSAAKPKATRGPGRKPKTKVETEAEVEETQDDNEPEEAEAPKQTDEEAAAAVKKIEFGKPKQETKEETVSEEEVEEEPVRKTAGKTSIFNFQNK